MPSYLFEGKLKQITPMIHFQAEEPGACLKASEVKPKLDRFIVEQCEKKGETIPDEWVIHTGERNGHRALNYKLMFSPIGEAIKSGEKTAWKTSQITHAKMRDINYERIHKNYFGNMASFSGNNLEQNLEQIDQKIKDTVFYSDGIDLKIICFIPKLMEQIIEHIRGFFLTHNFGTRQHKGFGSFTLEHRDEIKDIQILHTYFPKIFVVNYSIAENYNTVLDDISLLSALMKSGYNMTKRNGQNVYFKGFIFRYFMSKTISGLKISNEKRYLKELLLGYEGEDLPENPYFVRALLGTQDQLKFQKDDSDGVRWNAKVDIVQGQIKRFNNPILYKPVGNALYIIPSNIPDVLFDQPFEFEITRDSRVTDGRDRLNWDSCYQYISKEEKIVYTPPRTSFDIYDFLEAFAKDFNEKNVKHNGNAQSFVDAAKIDFRFKHLQNLTINII